MYLLAHLLYTILIGFIILFHIESAPPYYGYNPPYRNPYRGFRWDYSSSYTRYRCFSGDSLIRLSNGEYKQIDQLQSGDELITSDQSKLISTEMIMMLDKQTSRDALFYTITTDSGHRISLTEYHLIPIIDSNGNENYFFAKHVEIGDYLVVLVNETLNYSPVIDIIIEMKKGYYAPLTLTGTLFVNNVLASCFANVHDHHLAQYFMAPFRSYYTFARFLSIDKPFHIHQTNGIHWAVDIMWLLGRYFEPDALLL
ncbi:hypothetical protein I4U23_003790 [Adineta vaga]|nr:hypothetical protein I4U23_003790 [Adineta vaga]